MPKLILSSIMILMLVMSSAVNANSKWTNNPTVSNNFAREIVDLVNIERAKENLKPLKLSNSLSHYAQIRARKITKKFSHTRPSGSSCFSVVPRFVYRSLGENIAAGQRSTKEVVQAWMDSPPHRENIMNPKFTELGVGYLYIENSKYKHYWAQMFGLK